MSEQLDRRLFLRGLMLTSAGLIVPKPSLFALSACDGDDSIPYSIPCFINEERAIQYINTSRYGPDVDWMEMARRQSPIAAFNPFVEFVGPPEIW